MTSTLVQRRSAHTPSATAPTMTLKLIATPSASASPHNTTRRSKREHVRNHERERDERVRVAAVHHADRDEGMQPDERDHRGVARPFPQQPEQRADRGNRDQLVQETREEGRLADHRREPGHDHRERGAVDVGGALPHRADVPAHRVALEVHRIRVVRIVVVFGDDAPVHRVREHVLRLMRRRGDRETHGDRDRDHDPADRQRPARPTEGDEHDPRREPGDDQRGPLRGRERLARAAAAPSSRSPRARARCTRGRCRAARSARQRSSAVVPRPRAP